MILVLCLCLANFNSSTYLFIAAPNEESNSYATWKRKNPEAAAAQSQRHLAEKSAAATAQETIKQHFSTLDEWLKHSKLEKHKTAFIKHGFDTIDFVGEDIINDADLATMGINDPQDKHDLMEALKKKGYSQGNNNHRRLWLFYGI